LANRKLRKSLPGGRLTARQRARNHRFGKVRSPILQSVWSRLAKRNWWSKVGDCWPSIGARWSRGDLWRGQGKVSKVLGRLEGLGWTIEFFPWPL